LAAGLVRELRLGSDSAPDVLSIGLAATDYVGHTYGTGGQEMCLQLMELDREIGDFLARLDSWGLDYAVALTADHGGLDIPERLRAKGVADAAWIDSALSPASVGKGVAAAAKVDGPVIADGGPSGDIYLDPKLQGGDRSRALSALLAAYRAHPQVSAAFPASEIARTPVPTGDPARWSSIERVRASFDPQRSGDLYVVLKPHVQPIIDTSRYVSTHGSPWDYDRRVPIIFWRKGFGGISVNKSTETVDILPTLAAMVGLSLDRSKLDGACLDNVVSVVCPR
jgi:arylsulfatase A-like enzyme